MEWTKETVLYCQAESIKAYDNKTIIGVKMTITFEKGPNKELYFCTWKHFLQYWEKARKELFEKHGKNILCYI